MKSINFENRLWFKSYPKGMPKHLDYPEGSLSQFLDYSAKKFPQRAALNFYGKEINYQSLKNLSDRFARVLQDLGIKKGDRVAFLLPNSPEFVIAYFGVLKVGAIVIPLNPLYSPEELEYVLADSQPSILISLTIFEEKIKKVKPDLIPTLILSDLAAYLPLPLKTLLKIKSWSRLTKSISHHHLLNFEKLLSTDKEPYQKIPLTSQDLALLVYTSGTTGKPKAAKLSHGNMVANLTQLTAWLQGAVMEGQDVELGVLPFFHIYGITIGLNLAIHSALTLVLLPEFHSRATAKAITKYKINIAPVVPVMLRILLKRYKEKPKKYDFSSVRFWGSGASACEADLIKEANSIGKGVVIEGYGLTETSPLIAMNPFDGRQKLSSVGLPLPDTDCRVIDLETHQEVSPGKVGELMIKGPQVFSGYWHDEEKTKQVLTSDGWFYTKDIVYIDQDGYLFLKGRLDDMINVGGEKVWPQEVEDILVKHPGVEEAAVVGFPDMYFGEVLKAFIVPAKDNKAHTALQWELPAFCEKYLAKYKIPQKIELVSQIPKSHIGKTLHYQLKKK